MPRVKKENNRRKRPPEDARGYVEQEIRETENQIEWQTKLILPAISAPAAHVRYLH